MGPYSFHKENMMSNQTTESVAIRFANGDGNIPRGYTVMSTETGEIIIDGVPTLERAEAFCTRNNLVLPVRHDFGGVK